MESVKQLIFDGKTEEAIDILNKMIAQNQESDEAWYLLGNAYRKKGDFQHALNSYLKAMEINPESPAVEAHNMLIKILDFYNKDTYNP